MFNKKKNNSQTMEQPKVQDDIQMDEQGYVQANEQDELDFDFDDDETTKPYQNEEVAEEENTIGEGIPKETKEENIHQEETAELSREEKLQDIILYIIIDKSTSDMLSYFRGYGLNVARIFNNIDDAKNEIMMQIDPCRIVIVDTGTGRFSVMGARKSLIDLLGLGDDDTKISVYYTDIVIKEDISISEQVDNKQIDWIKYRSTADILATLLQKRKKENYVLDSTIESCETETKPEELMRYKGLTAKDDSMDLGQPSITPYDIQMNIDDDNDRIKQLQSYQVKY